MREISDGVRMFAEEPDSLLYEAPPPSRRIRTPSFTLVLAPSGTLATVSAIRTSEAALDATLAEVRRLVREAGHARTVWNVGPSCRPERLAAMLLERGFSPANTPPLEPVWTAMAIAEAPPPPRAGVEARHVRDLDEYRETWLIAMEAFEESEEAAAGWLAAVPALWAMQDGMERFAYLALVDGRPVGFAFAMAGPDGLLLGGSGVRAGARGRGAYRALLAIRWAEAVRLGKPALVIQASAMSRPILERSGFVTICPVDLLEDPAGASGSTP